MKIEFWRSIRKLLIVNTVLALIASIIATTTTNDGALPSWATFLMSFALFFLIFASLGGIVLVLLRVFPPLLRVLLFPPLFVLAVVIGFVKRVSEVAELSPYGLWGGWLRLIGYCLGYCLVAIAAVVAFIYLSLTNFLLAVIACALIIIVRKKRLTA
jgi:hypothetical protein